MVLMPDWKNSRGNSSTPFQRTAVKASQVAESNPSPCSPSQLTAHIHVIVLARRLTANGFGITDHRICSDKGQGGIAGHPLEEGVA